MNSNFRYVITELSYQRISGSNSKKAYGKWLRHDSKGKAAPSFQ